MYIPEKLEGFFSALEKAPIIRGIRRACERAYILRLLCVENGWLVNLIVKFIVVKGIHVVLPVRK